MRKSLIAAAGAVLAVPFLAIPVAPQAHAVDRCTIWYTPLSMQQYNDCEAHNACPYGYQNAGPCCSTTTFCDNPKN
jgi:hypothetical protein